MEIYYGRCARVCVCMRVIPLFPPRVQRAAAAPEKRLSRWPRFIFARFWASAFLAVATHCYASRGIYNNRTGGRIIPRHRREREREAFSIFSLAAPLFALDLLRLN